MTQKISETELLDGIKQGKTVAMNCFTLTDNFVKNLELVLKKILAYYEREELLPGIFSAAQELINWTSLSNKRLIYYRQNDLKIEDEKTFIANETKFLNTINQTNSESYRNFIVENNLFIHTVFEHSEESLNIKVYNSSENILNQEEFLRKYLKNAMNYENVLDYFQDHKEDPQGKNLGLAFSIIILKESGLRPDLMRISNKGTKGSFSRIEIPFQTNYQSIRDKILNDESIIPFERKKLVPDEYQKELDDRIKRMFPELIELYNS
jgi:hypothetical protein